MANKCIYFSCKSQNGTGCVRDSQVQKGLPLSAVVRGHRSSVEKVQDFVKTSKQKKEKIRTLQVFFKCKIALLDLQAFGLRPSSGRVHTDSACG